MRIIFVTQLYDPTDSVLGFTAGWVRALGERFPRGVALIANEVRQQRPRVPPGVQLISLGKEWGAGRVSRGLRYQAVLMRLAREGNPNALLAHMCPAYLSLGAPIARVFSIKLLLWYAHPSNTLGLRWAEHLADAVLTSLPGAYPRQGSKVRAIGQGIDTSQFQFTPLASRRELRLLGLGRTSPAKGFSTAIQGVFLARRQGLPVTLRIVGPSTTPLEVTHRRDLERLVAALELGDAVTFDEAVEPSRVPELLVDCDALINTMVGGSGDKVVFEAMAMGRLPLVSNEAFSPLLTGLSLRLMFREGDADDLARAIVELSRADERMYNSVARGLRRRVEGEHSLNHWAQVVAKVVDQLPARRFSSPGE